MIKREVTIEQAQNACGGQGTIEFAHWLTGGDMCPNLGLLTTITVPPGASVGDHTHTGEAEVYRAVSGTALYNDNGTEVEIGPGDVMVCYDGQTHGIKATGDEGFVFVALIVRG